MACHQRAAVASARVGQPEVKLGLIPGAGGTQRLPRLAGPAIAGEMCAFGEPIGAVQAKMHGIVDSIVEGDLVEATVRLAREAARHPIRRTRDREEKLGDQAVNAALFDALRTAAARRLRGQRAPLAAIEAVHAATTMPFDAGCRRESELFLECLQSDQSKALVHVFFGERTVAKVPDLPAETPVVPIGRAAVVGAGTMGAGIAMAYANAGVPVVVREVTQDALDRGLATIRRNYAATVKKGRLAPEEAERRLALITPALSLDACGDADIVVEAVFESMAVKQEVFAELDRVVRPGAILATNTSYLDIDAIASVTSRPRLVVGHHFFSPAHVMRLLEIVRGAATDPTVIATSMDLARRLGKVGVLVGNGRGFVGNRMYEPFVRETVFLVEEGNDPEAIDRALTDFGMAMGPLAVQDLSGLDVGYRIRQAFAHLRVPGVRYPFASDMLCEMGRLGQKTGAGWYRYDDQRTPAASPEVTAAVRRRARDLGIPQQVASADEIVERLVFALVNEGARVLEEGIARRSVDIDIIWINGYGFPAWRGGPMKYADLVGLEHVASRVRHLHARAGHHWRPAPLLERLAAEGRTFSNDRS
jgi:3-hydroxyacyl-CoA dehydrogenase